MLSTTLSPTLTPTLQCGGTTLCNIWLHYYCISLHNTRRRCIGLYCNCNIFNCISYALGDFKRIKVEGMPYIAVPHAMYGQTKMFAQMLTSFPSLTSFAWTLPLHLILFVAYLLLLKQWGGSRLLCRILKNSRCSCLRVGKRVIPLCGSQLSCFLSPKCKILIPPPC